MTNFQDPFWWSKITRQQLTFKKTKKAFSLVKSDSFEIEQNSVSGFFSLGKKKEESMFTEKGESVLKTSSKAPNPPQGGVRRQNKVFNYSFLKKSKSFTVFSKKDKKYKTFYMKEENKSIPFQANIFSSQRTSLNPFLAKQIDKTEFYLQSSVSKTVTPPQGGGNCRLADKKISYTNSLQFEPQRTNNQNSNKLFGFNFIEYSLQNYQRSNQDTCLTQRAVVKEGQWVEKGDLLADGAASIGGELALGQNILIAYMPWE